MRRRSLILSLLAVLLAVGAGYAWFKGQTPGNPGDAEKVTLTLKWLYDPGFAGEMVAARHGEFSKEGLDVTLQPGGFEINPVTLVASGSSQFGVAGADTFLIARSQGLPVVAIAAGYVETPVAFYSHADARIATMQDLRGKTVGVQAGQDTETIFQAMLGKAGMQLGDIKTYPAKYDLTPFLGRQVDVWPGYVATQSYILRDRGIPFSTLRPRDVGLNIPGTVYFTSEKFLADHPELVAGFARAVRAGWEFTYANRDDAARLVSSYDPKALPLPLVLANFADQQDQVRPNGYAFGELRRADWERLLQVLTDQKLLKGSVNLDDALKPQ